MYIYIYVLFSFIVYSSYFEYHRLRFFFFLNEGLGGAFDVPTDVEKKRRRRRKGEKRTSATITTAPNQTSSHSNGVFLLCFFFFVFFFFLTFVRMCL